MLVAVVPGKADGIPAHWLDLGWARCRLEDRQLAGNRPDWIAGLPAFLLSLLNTQSAGAGIAQEREAVHAAMAVLPLDFHAGAGGEVHFDGFWLCNLGHTIDDKERRCGPVLKLREVSAGEHE